MNRDLGGGPEQVLQGRIIICGIMIAVTFLIFLIRLFQLQIVESNVFKKKAQNNSIQIIRLDAPRGRMLDRHGNVLASTRPSFGLLAAPHEIHDLRGTATLLGYLTDRPESWFLERLGSLPWEKRFQRTRIIDDLSFDVFSRIESHLYALPGIFTDVQPRRHYQNGTRAAHLLGYLGEVHAVQLKREEFSDYLGGDVIGQSGLEKRFETHLRGRSGGRTVSVDASGRVIETIDEVSPTRGRDITLTIDLDLQTTAERALATFADRDFRSGGITVVAVETGEILAMASHPTYDPNDFSGGIDSESWSNITRNKGKPLLNRVLQNYPPGSVYKPIVASALLDDRLITPQDEVTCNGVFRFKGRDYQCWKRTGHGKVDLHQALRESCDVFFYQNGLKIHIDRLAEFAQFFGLGASPKLSLGQEAAGLVPSSDWKRKQFNESWYPGEMLSVSIGQGANLMTPLQLAVSYATIANGGTLYRPRILRNISSSSGIITSSEPEVLGTLPISSETLREVVVGLESSVEHPNGTGTAAQLDGIRVAGKTGTAQVVRLEATEHLEDHDIPVRYRDHAWFGAFAPVDKPEIAVAVFLEHGLHASTAAAPMAAEILGTYFKNRKLKNGKTLSYERYQTVAN